MAWLLAGCVTITDRAAEPTPVASGMVSPSGAVPPSAAPGDAPLASASPLRPVPDTSVVGYIALDEDVPWVRDVGAGIRAAAEQAGVELVACDSGWSREGALACAEELAAAGVGGVVAFQASSGVVCSALGGVPVIGVVFDQGACQISLLDIDQHASGSLAGEEVGRFAEARWDCDVDAWVSLSSNAADPVGVARMEGFRDGFTEHCPMPAMTHDLEGADRVVTSRTRFARLLEELEGRRIIVVAVNEDAILGAMQAAEAADRRTDVWYSGQLTDPSIRATIACDGHYIASVAQFPERFGASLVPALVDAMAGREVPPRLEAELVAVTRENVRELFPGTQSCDE